MIINSLLVLAVGASVWVAQRYERPSSLTQAMVGAVAPHFELPVVSATNTEERRVELPQSRMTLLNFWASWCGACAQEETDLRYLWDTYGAKGSLNMIGVATSDQLSELKTSPKLKAKPFTVVFDETNTVAKAYGIVALPVSVLVGPNGEVLARIEGILDASDIKLIESKIQ